MDPLQDPHTAPATLFARATETVQIVRKNLPPELQNPKVAIVCGSGLGGLADTTEASPRVEMWYEDVAGFPRSTVAGHEGKLVFGVIGPSKTPVVLLVGRAHFYEGHTMELVTYATRVCKLLSVQIMIVTNAAGGLNPDYSVGDIVMLNDHINIAGFAGFHPLRGPNDESFGVRFPPLSDAYDLELRRRGHAAWQKLRAADVGTSSKRRLHEGIYSFVAGPSYETRAECRLLRLVGADLVGMSTVPEIIVARHSGIRVLALSLVTNSAVLEAGPRGDDPAIAGMNVAELEEYLSRGRANHEEVLEAGREAAKDMVGLVRQILVDLDV
ncbi:purine nucleoside phosphorylase-like protein [Rhizodiscina lignyota]|uniref:Purine nucleoside phosphorylase n=1 Tax=Rhizodiscina lignyota TaxID=1504668 RepID=A0A9P4IAC1_9PEZI|nr:purine nucleoside phosphorylase-like protein [Rhizodiscina lignyota]